MNEDYLEVAKEAAVEAAKAQKTSFEEYSDFVYKKNDEIVTHADYESESIIKSEINEVFPEHKIVSEESGPKKIPNSDYVWIVDPIDGTVNFQHGYPQFSIAIALLDTEGVRVSVIHNPISREMFTAVRNNGAKLNDEPISVSDRTQWCESLIAASWSDREYTEKEIFDKLREIHTSTHGFRKTGSAVLSMALTAAGVFDGYCSISLSEWDVAAGLLLIEEAGGKVTNLAVEDKHRKIIDDSIIATNGHIHERFRETLEMF
jgi:myo-inositol-1(or 4)-monophosphatase